MTDHVCSPGCNHHSHIGENEKGEFAAGKEKIFSNISKGSIAAAGVELDLAGRDSLEGSVKTAAATAVAGLVAAATAAVARAEAAAG